MDGLQLRDEAVRDRIRLAEEFLDPSDLRARSYRADIILMLNRGLRRLTVSLDEIRSHNRTLADGYVCTMRYGLVALMRKTAYYKLHSTSPKHLIGRSRTSLSPYLTDRQLNLQMTQCTTVPTLEALANTHATPGHSARTI